jgi:hypothetical protein
MSACYSRAINHNVKDHSSQAGTTVLPDSEGLASKSKMAGNPVQMKGTMAAMSYERMTRHSNSHKCSANE